MSITAWSPRLVAVGATPNEISAITSSYYATPQTVQDALDALVAGLANADLLAMLNSWRTSGGPFAARFPGGGLPFGTGVAVLTGLSADDADAIGAGTGQKIAMVRAGTDGTVGGPGGSPLAPSAVTTASPVTGEVTFKAPSANPILANKPNAADANPTFQIGGDGTLSWGPGGASAPDMSLSRNAFGPSARITTASFLKLEAWNASQRVFAVGADATNLALGTSVLESNTTGGYNTAAGWQAGYTSVAPNANVSGNQNSYFGYQAGSGTATQLSNSTAIGALATVTASNALVLGAIANINGAVSTTSVGIGVAAPLSRLHVAAGDIRISGAGNGLILTSPDGLTTRTISLSNTGTIVVA